jgi:hypothetical protein
MGGAIMAQGEEVVGDHRSGDIVAAVAGVLPLASMAQIAAGIAAAVSLSGGRLSDRVAYGAARFVGAFVSGLALAAATMVTVSVRRRDRLASWTRAASGFVAVVVICAGLYLMWFLITIHVPNPIGAPQSSDFSAYIVRSQYDAWGARIAEMFFTTAGIVLAAMTLVVLGRRWRAAEPPQIIAS